MAATYESSRIMADYRRQSHSKAETRTSNSIHTSARPLNINSEILRQGKHFKSNSRHVPDLDYADDSICHLFSSLLSPNDKESSKKDVLNQRARSEGPRQRDSSQPYKLPSHSRLGGEQGRSSSNFLDILLADPDNRRKPLDTAHKVPSSPEYLHFSLPSSETVVLDGEDHQDDVQIVSVRRIKQAAHARSAQSKRPSSDAPGSYPTSLTRQDAALNDQLRATKQRVSMVEKEEAGHKLATVSTRDKIQKVADRKKLWANAPGSEAHEDQARRLLKEQKKQSMPMIPGGFKPTNRLTVDKTAQTPSSQRPPKTFDLTSATVRPRVEVPDRANKRQKIENRGETGPRSSVEAVDERDTKRSRPSVVLPGASTSYDWQQKKVSQGGEFGSAHAHNAAESFPRRRRRRRSSNANIDSGEFNGGERQPPMWKQHSSEASRNHDLKDDPIVSDEETRGRSSESNVRVEIKTSAAPTGSTDGRYNGTAHLKPARSSKLTSMAEKSSNRKGGTTSPYFSQQAMTKIDGEQFNDSIDDLSKDHYNVDDLVVAKSLLPAKGKRRLQQHSREQNITSSASTNNHYTVPIKSDSEGERDREVEIKPSTFKSRNSKPSNTPDQETFRVVTAFSEKRLWVNEDPNGTWRLVFDNKLEMLNLLDENNALAYEIQVSRLEKLDYSPRNPKIILYKSRDYNKDIGVRIHMEFIDFDESDRLRELIRSTTPNVGRNNSDLQRLERVFARTLEELRLQYKKKSSPKEKALDVLLIESKVRRKQQRQFDEAQSRKQISITPNIIQKAFDEIETRHPSTRKVAESMRSHKDVEAPMNAQRRLSKGSIEPDNFYGTGGKSAVFTSARSTRGSERASTYCPPQRSPSPPPRWTELNPEYEEQWKASLVYPREGAKKATVDLQDIPRLDEGEFLNDNLISFQIQWLEEHLKETNPELAKRVYFQNTFFYERLTKDPPKGKKINYDAVQRWTAKINLLDFDYIIVPVNENWHWYVAIIYKAKELLPTTTTIDLVGDGNDPTKAYRIEESSLKIAPSSSSPDRSTKVRAAIDAQDLSDDIQNEVSLHVGENSTPVNTEVVDDEDEQPVVSDLVAALPTKSVSTPSKNERRKSGGIPRKVDFNAPRIIVLDSLGLSHSSTSTNLRAYLVAEIKSRTGIVVDPPPRLGLTAKHLPLQTNHCDCGLYVLMYIEMFLKRGDEFIHGLLQGAQDLDLDWGNASDLRNSIRDTLFTLQEQQIAEDAKAKIDKARKKLQRDGGRDAVKADVSGTSKAPVESSDLPTGNEAEAQKPLRTFKGIENLSGSIQVSTQSLDPSIPPNFRPADDAKGDGIWDLAPRRMSSVPAATCNPKARNGSNQESETTAQHHQDEYDLTLPQNTPPRRGSRRQGSSTPTRSRNNDSRVREVVEIQESPVGAESLPPIGLGTNGSTTSSPRRHGPEGKRKQDKHPPVVNIDTDDEPVELVQITETTEHLMQKGKQKRLTDNDEMLLDNEIEDVAGGCDNPLAVSDSSPTSTKKSPKYSSPSRSRREARREDGAIQTAEAIVTGTSPTVASPPVSHKRKSAPTESELDRTTKQFKPLVDSSDSAVVGKHVRRVRRSEPRPVQRTHQRFSEEPTAPHE